MVTPSHVLLDCFETWWWWDAGSTDRDGASTGSRCVSNRTASTSAGMARERCVHRSHRWEPITVGEVTLCHGVHGFAAGNREIPTARLPRQLPCRQREGLVTSSWVVGSTQGPVHGNELSGQDVVAWSQNHFQPFMPEWNNEKVDFAAAAAQHVKIKWRHRNVDKCVISRGSCRQYVQTSSCL